MKTAFKALSLLISVATMHAAHADINVSISSAKIVAKSFAYGSQKLQSVSIQIKKTSDTGKEVTALIPICPELLRDAQQSGIAKLESIYDSVSAAENLKRSVQIEGRASGVNAQGLTNICFTSVSTFVNAEELGR